MRTKTSAELLPCDLPISDHGACLVVDSVGVVVGLLEAAAVLGVDVVVVVENLHLEGPLQKQDNHPETWVSKD